MFPIPVQIHEFAFMFCVVLKLRITSLEEQLRSTSLENVALRKVLYSNDLLHVVIFFFV